jgi:hypothetical protein
MDAGNLKQPFGKSTKKHPLGTGMFKVGDYDDDETPAAAPKSHGHGSFTESVKSELKKATGHHHKETIPAEGAASKEKD